MQKFQKSSFVDAGSIPTLEPILQNWIEVQQAYARTMDHQDFAWWYGERTCVGFLSAAAWQSGGVTLEEWHTDKGPKRQPQKGRCDLYISYKAQEFFVEAKHMYSRATGVAKRELGYIKSELGRAVRDARQLQCERSQKLGVLFVAPFYPHKKQHLLEDHLGEWLQKVRNEVPHSACAWLHAPYNRIKGNPDLLDSPGVLLLIRSI